MKMNLFSKLCYLMMNENEMSFLSFNESHFNDKIFQNNAKIDVFDKNVICFEWKE